MSDRSPRAGHRGGARRRWSRLFLHGLNTSVTGNAQAFGYSITITATFGAVSVVHGAPRLGDVLAFALAAALAFSALNLLEAHLAAAKDPGREPVRVQLIGTATDVLAVASAVGVAAAAAHAPPGVAWWLAPLAATPVYVLIQAVELAVGHERSGQGSSPGDG